MKNIKEFKNLKDFKNIKEFKKIREFNSSLSFVIIGSIIILLLVFSVLIEAIGFIKFSNSMTREYNNFTYKTAQTAAAIIKPDNFESYLESNGENEEYKLTKERLDVLCDKQGVSAIYVIKPDSDFKNFTSIFNLVNKKSKYSPWEIGSKHQTTNEEYENNYRQIYENGQERATIIVSKTFNNGYPYITSMIPLKDSNGNVKAILCVQRFMRELSSVRRDYLVGVTFTTIVLIVVTSIITRKFINKQIINPIKKVTFEAKRFTKENNKINNDLSVNISKVKEINTLANSVDKMEQDIVNYIDNITAITKEKERIGTELHYARSIQQNALPGNFPAFPNRKDFDIYASMNPAKEVGGDFYDYFLVDNDHLALVIADVSGKGIPAALFMMITKILIAENTLSGKTPGEILSVVNNRICKNNKTNMFVTVWLGILELSTGKLVSANAGHEKPVFYRRNKKFEIENTKHGIVLGAMENYNYKNEENRLQKGDKIFVYTDGIPEATNEEEKMFGLDRMLKTLNKCTNMNPKNIIDNLKKDVDEYVGNATQFDDLTMLCVEIKE